MFNTLYYTSYIIEHFHKTIILYEIKIAITIFLFFLLYICTGIYVIMYNVYVYKKKFYMHKSIFIFLFF